MLEPTPVGGVRLNAGWYRHLAVDTVFDVGEEERSAYRRRLGINLERIRSTLTTHTQESLADALGVDAETYGRWERGSREPKAYDLFRIADILGVPADWLVAPTDSISEIDRRLSQLRAAAADAARVEAERVQRAAAGKAPQRGKRS